MHKKNDVFIPSKKDVAKSMTQCRRVARDKKGNYDGAINVYFDAGTGIFHFLESVGGFDYCTTMHYIGSVEIRNWN